MARWEEHLFTRVPDGWAFNAAPLIFGAPRVYILDETQKTRVAARLRRWNAIAFVLAVAIALAALAGSAPALHALGVPAPEAALGAGALLAWGLAVGGVVAVIGLIIVALSFATRLILAPVLAGARRGAAPLGFVARLRAQPQFFPLPTRIGFAVAFALVAAGEGWTVVHAAAPRIGSLMIAVAFALLALGPLALLLLGRTPAR